MELPEGVDPESPFVSMIDPATGTGTFVVEWIRQARENLDHDSKTRALSGTAAETRWHAWLRDVVLRQLNALEISLASYAVAHLKVSLLLPDETRAAVRLPIFLGDTLAAPRDEGQFEQMRDPVSVEGLEAERVKFGSRHSVVVGNPPYDRVTQEAVTGWLTEPGPSGASPLDDIRQPAVENTIFSHVASLYNLYVYFWRWAIWKAFEQKTGPGVVSFITASSWLTGPGFLGLRQLARRLADECWIVDLGGDNRGAHPEVNVFDIETPVAIVTLVRTGGGDPEHPAQAHYRRIHGTRNEKLDELAALESLDLSDPEWLPAPDGWHEPLAPPGGGDAWEAFPALTDLFPWQQPGCKFGRTWPIAPSEETLKRRWSRFVETDDPDDRARCFVTTATGRRIQTSVRDLPRLVDLEVGASPPPIARYAYRTLDRQFAFADPRLASLERPSLWSSLSTRQIFMITKTTFVLGSGPAATVSTAVPDLDIFRGSFGGKDVIPLYRDANGSPNVSGATVTALNAIHGGGTNRITPERLFAYAYAILAGCNYTDRFAEALATPGPRIPISADPELFDEAVGYGEELLWLHTYGERCEPKTPPRAISSDDSVTWVVPVVRMPENIGDITYDEAAGKLTVSDGVVSGVRPEVWAFEVSGMQVVRKWLGYRTRRGAGRAATSPSPLDAIRPTEWSPEWSDELIDLLVVLTRALDLQPKGIELLDRICAGPLIASSDLPPVATDLRKPPKVEQATMQLKM